MQVYCLRKQNKMAIGVCLCKYIVQNYVHNNTLKSEDDYTFLVKAVDNLSFSCEFMLIKKFVVK